MCSDIYPWSLSVSRSSQFSPSYALEKLFATRNRYCLWTNILAYFLAKWRLLFIYFFCFCFCFFTTTLLIKRKNIYLYTQYTSLLTLLTKNIQYTTKTLQKLCYLLFIYLHHLQHGISVVWVH